MDAVASVDEPISYEIRGVGDKPASNDELSKYQPQIGTIVFLPGETQKPLIVTLPENPASEPDRTFEVQLTSSLAWVTPNPDKDSVIALVSSTPKNGSIFLINEQAYFAQTKTISYAPTKVNDYVLISGGSIIDTMAGDDKVIATSGDNVINTGDGNDQITLANGYSPRQDKNIVSAGNGNDRIVFTDLNLAAYSNIDGGKGTDILDFSNLTGIETDGVAVDLSKGNFHDRNDASVALNKTKAGQLKGIEHVIGSNQSDSLTGSKSIDVLDGGPGNDEIRSMDGNDNLSGGDGSDELDGGLGGDKLTGGEGNDTFVFGSSKDLSKETRKTDTITDFKHGEDLIRLQFDLNTKEKGNQYSVNFNFIGTEFFTKVAGQIRYTSPVTNGSESYILLQGDTNGDGQADWSIKLVGVSSIENSDFDLY
jgi:Ca2+-binding RTX toxin-like protein